MRPNVYVDIQLSGADASGMSPFVLRSEAFMQLHGHFAKMPGTYALAIPRERFDVLRVFASDRDSLDTLATELKADRWFRDYVRLAYPMTIGNDYGGPRVAFVRWRIPTIKSDRHATGGSSALRDRRLQQARERRLDHFQTRSRSTGSRFSLTVERVERDDLPLEGQPNSYGLSSRQFPLGLPDLP